MDPLERAQKVLNLLFIQTTNFLLQPSKSPVATFVGPFHPYSKPLDPEILYRYIGPHCSNQAANLLQAYTTHTFLYIESKGEFYIPTNKNFK